MSASALIRRSFAALCAALFVAAAAPALADSGPTTRVSDGELLELDSGLSHGYLPPQESTELHARLKVRADDVQAEERPPLNLAVVIDRSGSMSGGRLEQAKRAAHKLVDRLSSQDRLAIVEYGSSVEVRTDSLRVTPEHQDKFHREISAISDDGGTFLSGGYEKGRSIVARESSEDSVDRVVLLSDGKANEGIDSASALGNLAKEGLEAGVSTTTMGIGLNYDEGIMTALAEHGAGNHYFIEDETEIASMFGEEFKSLSSVVARDAYVVLELGEGIELLDVHGFSHRRSDDGNVVVDLGAFYARQQRDILLDLAASPTGEGRRVVADAHLHFTDVTGDSDRGVSNSTSLVAVGTDDADKRARTQDWVTERVEQVVYAENLDAANEAYENGNREKANEIIDRQKKRLDDAGDKDLFSEKKVQEKKEELEEKESTIRGRSAGSSSGKRLKKESAGESLELMKDSSNF